MRVDEMSLSVISVAVQAPLRSFQCPSAIAIPPSSLSSRSTPYSSSNLRPRFCAVSCCQRFVAVYPTHQLADDAGENKGCLHRASFLVTSRLSDDVRSPGYEVLQPTSFRCAALGNAGDGEADLLDVARANSIGNEDALLVSGSPVVIVEAPVMLKTAEPMPMMRPNRGLIKPGDAGRVIDRRPKGLWAVRLAVGAYLIDRKCFKPLDVE